MRKDFNNISEPITMALRVLTKSPQKIRIIVADTKKANTDYINRWCIVNGREDFFLRLPQIPASGYIMVYNEKNGDLPPGKDKSFQALAPVYLPLERKLKAFNNGDPVITSFVKLAKEFSEDAGILSAGGSVYLSDDGNFVIEYFDHIRDRETGEILNTPARISQGEGRIQVSQDKFKEYTIPMRMIILLHEFCHFFVNKNMDDETEADLNALLIYLGLGYPRIEAFQAFKTVFYRAASPGNKKRLDKIVDFISEFENHQMKINYENKVSNKII